MDAVELALIVLAVLVVFLSIGLVIANMRTARFADKSLEHAMAWSVDQREFIRVRFEADHQEFLLREARRRDKGNDRFVRVPSPDETANVPMIPIEPNNAD